MEPCKEAFLPADIKTSVVVFELSTYDEYIYEIVLKSLKVGEEVDEKNILNEETFKRVRKEKIKVIKANYDKPYMILTQKQLKELTVESGYVIRELLVNDLVSENNANFENYTTFFISDLKTSSSHKLADPTDELISNCHFNKKQYKFVDLLTLLLN